MAKNHFDTLIIGGGAAGITVAASLRKRIAQAPCLAGKNQGRIVAQNVLDLTERFRVGILWQMLRGAVAPAAWRPGFAGRRGLHGRMR